MPKCPMRIETHHEKTNNLHMRTAKKQISFAVTAKLISALVFAIRIVQFLYFINPKFQASSHLLCLYSSVCGGPVRKSHCWFPHAAAQLLLDSMSKEDAMILMKIISDVLEPMAMYRTCSCVLIKTCLQVIITKTCPCNMQRFF